MTIPIKTAQACKEMPKHAVYLRHGDLGHFHLVGCCGGSLQQCNGGLA